MAHPHGMTSKVGFHDFLCHVAFNLIIDPFVDLPEAISLRNTSTTAPASLSVSVLLSMGPCLYFLLNRRWAGQRDSQGGKWVWWWRVKCGISPCCSPTYVDHVPVKANMSDWREKKIEWCWSHDGECEVIARNARALYDSRVCE
jgi:hypothetical protein